MQEVVSAVEKVAAGEVVLSPNLAGSMLRELTASAEVRHYLITKREADALQLVADGYSTHEVASRLLVNDRTVARDLSSAYGKLDSRRLDRSDPQQRALGDHRQRGLVGGGARELIRRPQ